ncbi:transcription factor PIF3 [Lathyrus oleraceus]|nr:transcription factor PIF3-like [Pisum sativum]
MMHLHEFYGMSKQKVDHKEINKDQSSVHKNDLLELVSENDQISVQVQSRGEKSPTCKTLPSHTLKGHHDDLIMMPSLLHQCQPSLENDIPSSSTIVNFTHFAKPVAIVKANLQKISLSSSRSQSVGIKNNRPDLKYLKPKSPEQDADVSTPVCKGDVFKVDRTSNQVLGRNGQEDVEKCTKPVEVSSSVCSDNGAYRGSDDPNQNLKGKNIYSDDFDWHSHSEDVEDESVGIKKKAHGRGGFGSKRNRSAEVHNLSERKQRDTINEKMRTLQELIPNCNKVDKASMLDEAIEYLKTLQLQLEIMSMRGGGLYMPMMLPAGMQQMHMSPFSAMQMGLGVPQFQGTHLPVAHASGLSALHGMAAARPNPQMFGLPCHGLHMPMPCAPMFSFPMPNVNSQQVMQNIDECNSANPRSIQCEATNDKEAFTLDNEDKPVIEKCNE